MVAATTLDSYATIPSAAAESIAHPRKELLAALALLVKVTDRHSTMPVLAELALSCQQARQQITATDLNCSVTYLAPFCGAPVQGLMVKAKLLHDMVKSATGDTVILSKSGTGITVASNGADTTIMAAVLDFPKIPAMPERLDKVDGALIADGLATCLPTVCKDETRFHLNGILIEGRASFHTLVSTDGHRLTKIHASGETILGTGILPSKAARLLVALCKLGEARMAIVKHLLHVTVTTASGALWEASFKLIDAKYPPYEQVIPTGYEKLATVDRKALVAAMKRAKVLCTETRGAKITVSAGKLTITADHPDNGTTSESLKADSEWLETAGGVHNYGICASYLLDAIEAIDCKHVTIAFGGELDPILVRGTDDAVEYSVAQSHHLAVIMPMRI